MTDVSVPHDVLRDTVSIRELYTLVDQRIGDVNKSIERLEQKFDALEAGRLSRLEGVVSNIQGNQKGRDAQLIAIFTVIMAVISFLGVLVQLYIHR